MDATPFAAVFEDVVVVYDASAFTAYVAVAVSLDLRVKYHTGISAFCFVFIF